MTELTAHMLLGHMVDSVVDITVDTQPQKVPAPRGPFSGEDSRSPLINLRHKRPP